MSYVLDGKHFDPSYGTEIPQEAFHLAVAVCDGFSLDELQVLNGRGGLQRLESYLTDVLRGLGKNEDARKHIQGALLSDLHTLTSIVNAVRQVSGKPPLDDFFQKADIFK
jgi:hypothetical protein